MKAKYGLIGFILGIGIIAVIAATLSSSNFNSQQFISDGATQPTMSIRNGVILTNPVIGSGVITGNGSGLSNVVASSVYASNVVSGGTIGAAVVGTFTGDITTPGGSYATTLKNTGTAGTYLSTTFDAQGRETSGTSVANSSGALTNNGSGVLGWFNGFGTGNGTVTSVGASGPAGFTWSSAVTSSGTLTATTPGLVLTNGHSQATTLSNIFTMDATHYWSGPASFSVVTNAALMASRVVLSDANKALASATASGAVPIDADGTATTFAQINTLAPGTVITNGHSAAVTVSNTWTFKDAANASATITNGVIVGAISASVITNAGGTANTVASFDANKKSVGLATAAYGAQAGAYYQAPTYGNNTLSMTQVSRLGSRKVAYWWPGSALVSSGETSPPTVQGSAAVQIGATVSTHRSLEFYTPATTANTNYVNDASSDIPLGKSGTFNFYVQCTNVSVANTRMWVGLSAAWSSNANAETNAAQTYVAFLGSATNWANWQFVIDDATASHYSIVDTGVALTTLVTNFTVIVNGSGSAFINAVGMLNGVLVATNTPANLPTGVVKKGVAVATLANAASGFRVLSVTSEQDY